MWRRWPQSLLFPELSLQECLLAREGLAVTAGPRRRCLQWADVVRGGRVVTRSRSPGRVAARADPWGRD